MYFRIAVRLAGSLIFAGLVVAASKYLNKEKSVPWAEYGGELIRCSSRFPFGESDHAEILTYGLEDPRGVAWDPVRERVLIADGSRHNIIVYSPKSGQIMSPASEGLPCPGGSCDALDLRGLTMRDKLLLVAEHDRAKIATWPLEGGVRGAITVSGLSGPIGIASRGGDLFITDDRSWPGDPVSPFGVLYRVKPDQTAEPIDSRLVHPTGVAMSPDEGTIYVTESDAHRTRWIKFAISSSGSWTRAGVLATAVAPDGNVPEFLGIATSGTFVFCAGPGGIYVFDSGGDSLGRIEFEGKVAGVAIGKDTQNNECLYFTVAHNLCRIALKR
jgi:sugar lactone lactonase YvrE